MKYEVTIYCPDRHILYDGRTPERHGVGGGVTARVRMARALARLGHRVTVIANCPRRARIDKVAYVPLEAASRIEGDVVVWTTSGGGLDLAPAARLPTEARLRIIWVHGPVRPGGFDSLPHDCVYAVSNFVGRAVRTEWGVAGTRLFVVYNGYEEGHFTRAQVWRFRRDPRQLVYFSHPSKGLEAAIGVLRRLRQVDPAWQLLVLGGPGLWGEAAGAHLDEPGVIDRGLVGQAALALELIRSAFSLHLQTREEPGSLAIVEAQRAGCVIVGSPVGCFPEYVRDGEEGFLVHGDPLSADVQAKAARLVLEVSRDPEMLTRVRRAALSAAMSCDLLARVWSADWDRRLGADLSDAAQPACPACGGATVLLADGLHCRECGTFAHASRREDGRLA
jgi:glycosyltransferase involved in cell wall biosynthesis